MYIYFDKNGTIKEVINDESIRRGSNDYNKIYCYLEGNPVIDDIWYLQKNPDGTLTNEVSFIDNIVTKSIPYDSKRDMKYFQDFEEYKFYVFTLSSSYLSQNGLVVATIRVAENNTLWALGELTFNVQANIVNSDNDITQSQYDYLLLTISSYYSKTEIDNKLSLKADKSDTYTKQEVVIFVDTLSTNKADKTYVDNALSEKADKSNTYTKSEVDSALFKKANSENVYSKSQMDNLLDGKVNYSDTYTRNVIDNFVLDLEVKKANKSDVYTKTEVDSKFEGAGEEFGTLSNAILDLQSSVSDLKSVQNVVDVVATKSALNSYDTSKLETNDKVQVIADETHDGASTIYNWDGSAWQYIGAYGTNSYTKEEVDTKLSTKADKTDTYTKQEVDGKLNGYIKNDDTTYSATVRGKEVVVSAGAGYGSATYTHSHIQTRNPRKPTCTYDFPDEKSGTLALTTDIPTVNNPTITFTQGGTTKGSISLNQASDQTIALDAGGSGGGSNVVANPTLSGNEATLNGLEVDGTKYKVGGGSGGKLYLHKFRIKKNTLYNTSGSTIGTKLYLLYSIVTSSNEPITFDTFMNITHLNGYGAHFGTNVVGDITITNTMRALNSFSSYDANDKAEISYIGDGAVLTYTSCVFDSVDIMSDTITEV